MGLPFGRRAARGAKGEVSLARQSTYASRKVLIVALCGFLAMLALLAAHSAWSNRTVQTARYELARAQLLVENLRNDDLNVSMLVNLAVRTGERQWVDRFRTLAPWIYRRLDEAKIIAGPDLAQRFDQEMAEPLSAVREAHQKVFKLVLSGEAERAYEIVRTERYTKLRNELTAAADRLFEGMIARAEGAVDDLRRRAVLIGTLIVVVGLSLIGTIVMLLLRRCEKAHAKVEGELRRLALTDHLTKLANRSAFERRLERCVRDDDDAASPLQQHGDGGAGQMANARSTASNDGAAAGFAMVEQADRGEVEPVGCRGRYALVAVDINDFRTLNDLHGHNAGDVLLKKVAERIEREFANDFLARVSGDEFAVLVETGVAGIAGVERRARGLLHRLAEPIAISRADVELTASVGICGIAPDASPAAVRKGAEIALEAAKSASGSRGEAMVFTQGMQAEHVAKIAMEQELRVAMGEGRFKAHLQPIVDLTNSQIVCAEALARYHRGPDELVGPHAFLQHLERMGLIGDLTFIIMEDACRQALRWPLRVSVSVNVPPTQLRDDFAVRTLQLLERIGLDPARLEIEVLETALATYESGTVEVLKELRANGVRVALDDFGVGYSSLGQLSHLPIDKLKIDRSFVLAMGADRSADPFNQPRNAEAVIHAAVDLAEAFGLSVVAEGVETIEHEAQLRAMGCDFCQGFLYARPLAPDDFHSHLHLHRPHANDRLANLALVGTAS